MALELVTSLRPAGRKSRDMFRLSMKLRPQSSLGLNLSTASPALHKRLPMRGFLQSAAITLLL
jgi:hypothetical protein